MSSDPWQPSIFTVEWVKQLNADCCSFRLKPMDDSTCDFSAGQFNMLYSFGCGESAISISGGDSKGIEHCVRSVGAVSEGLCQLEAGQKLALRGPYGQGWPFEEAKNQDLLMIAGGIGLAPLRPLVEKAIANRADFDRCILLYGCRSPEDLLFKDEYQAWQDKGIEMHITVDNAGSDWTGNVGVVTELLNLVDFDVENSSAMLCGPEIMIRFVCSDLENLGLPNHKTFVSLERNMKCAIGLCGHCQFGAEFICKDGPVFPYARVKDLMAVREL